MGLLRVAMLPRPAKLLLLDEVAPLRLELRHLHARLRQHQPQRLQLQVVRLLFALM